MHYKKKLITLILLLSVFSSFVYSYDVYGNYTYNLDTVLSMMKLSFIEEGINPDSNEFKENIEDAKVMIFAFGEKSFVNKMREQAPFSSIEITNELLIIHLEKNNFEIPIEIVKNEILSKAPDTFDEIIGYLESGKLYFNFFISYDNSKKALVNEDILPYYLIPFEKEI
ncbi:MAG: hypothetical protein ACPKM0_08040 [Pleomorphochaeta sp.]